MCLLASNDGKQVGRVDGSADGGVDGGGVDSGVRLANIIHIDGTIRTWLALISSQEIDTHLSFITAVSIPAETAANTSEILITIVVTLHQVQPLLAVENKEGEPQIPCNQVVE